MEVLKRLIQRKSCYLSSPKVISRCRRFNKMSEILVISYSNTGTSRRLAQMLCQQQGWPMAEISEVQPRCGFSGQLSCLLDSWMRRRPPIFYMGPPPNEYDAVVLVAPVWSWRLAGPVRSFLKLMNEQLPDLVMVSVTQNPGAPAVKRSPRITSVMVQ